MPNTNLWDACEECGSTRLTFARQEDQDALTFVRCDECNYTWEDSYPEVWEEDT